ncbi:MAG: ABC transporter permease [Bacteriovoracaceae bacterium]|nr:ABC transporter permease [Bacteriovoracaceae bacterium]
MFKTYLKYFLLYILSAKNRQRLLILAVVGLFISAFALIVLQSTMGGLQNKLMERSKAVIGKGTIYFKAEQSDERLQDLFSLLDNKGVQYSKEYEIELLVRYKTFITPVIVHGIDQSGFVPAILRNDLKTNIDRKKVDAIIPLDLAYKIGVAPPETLQLISPAHVDNFLDDIPRSQSIQVDRTMTSDVPEIDLYHLWVRLPLIQNLIQARDLNRVRIYSDVDFLEIEKKLPVDMELKTWEQENATLVWALKLESTVMIFLFAAMSLLVSLCISSGLLIFFNKIKSDLASFWILGASLSKIDRATKYFLHMMSFFSIFSGLIFGLVFLWIFDHYAPEIMPDMFVDRKIPILVTAKGLFVAFIVPYSISSIFITFALRQFRREHDLLDHVRSVS